MIYQFMYLNQIFQYWSCHVFSNFVKVNSESATNLEKISDLGMTISVNVKYKWKITPNFVALPEILNLQNQTIFLLQLIKKFWHLPNPNKTRLFF